MSIDEDVQHLLQFHESLGGVPPSDAPELQDLFAKISEAKAAAPNTGASSGHIQIHPVAGFVVKTLDAAKRKVFINFCSSDRVEPPVSWSNGVMPDAARCALLKHGTGTVAAADAAEGMRIPLSLSEARNERDRSGRPCTVFDVVLAGAVMRGAEESQAVKATVIEVGMAWIDSKHSLGLDARFKLPKLKYKGDAIHPHWIRDEQRALISECKPDGGDGGESDSDGDAPGLALRCLKVPAHKRMDLAAGGKTPKDARRAGAGSSQASERHGARAPAVASPCEAATARTGVALSRASGAEAIGVQGWEYFGAPCDRVALSLTLPPAATASGSAGIAVLANRDAVHVRAPGCAPCAVDSNVLLDAARCVAHLEGVHLRIEAPLLSAAATVRQLLASRPLPVGSIDLKCMDFMNELE